MTDRTQPPSNELMCKVVAKWKGWEFDQIEHTTPNGIHRFWDNETNEFQSDPRTDTDAALELRTDIMDTLDRKNQSDDFYIEEGGHGWSVVRYDGDGDPRDYTHDYFPISGEPFRTAVCWLAVDVLGVE